MLRKRVMETKSKYAKRIRLKHFSYKGFYRYFITMSCYKRSDYFADSDLIAEILSILQAAAKQESFFIWAYCFMPQHLHLLIEGNAEDSDMRKFVSLLKQKSGYWFQHNRGVKLWQENYYEHVLRKDEETAQVARYIFENPVRNGYVKDYSEYPYSGSFQLEDIRLM